MRGGMKAHLMLSEVEAEVAEEAVRVHDDERQLARRARGRHLAERILTHLGGDDHREGRQKIRARGKNLRNVLADVRAGDVLVELLEQHCDALGALLAEAAAVEEKVVAEVGARDGGAVDDGKRADSGKHEVFERLRARRAAVDQAD